VKLTRFFFLAAIFTVTFEKIHWDVAGQIYLADVCALGFIASFTADRLARGDDRVPRTSVVATGFLVAFLVVYLVGYFGLDTAVAAAQYGKGMTKFAIHFLFLIMGVAYLARASRTFYWQTLGFFTAGMVVNSAYGLLQLLLARSGSSLDQAILSPITGGASNINIYGAIDGANVYRPNAITGDPNHLGVMLIIPLLALTPVYLRLERGHRLKTPLAVSLGFLLIVELTTLSRSGLLGLIVGLAVLALPYRRFFLTKAFLAPLAAVVGLLGIVVLSRLDYFETIIRSRVQTGGGASQAHLGVYDFIPNILSTKPLFGLGLNNFSVYYEQVTGKTNWGPHSFYVALLVETGLVGAALFGVFVWYLFARLGAARRVGRLLAGRQDVAAARVTPLAWGMTAALAGTLAGNVFYLTMSFYYFYVFAALVLALPVVFGRGLVEDEAAVAARRPHSPPLRTVHSRGT
jgi:O-antigen ligase